MKQIPEFLQNLYTHTEKETRPFSKIFAFIHLSEAVIKFYTVVTVQNFLETEIGNPSLEEGKAVLGKGLARPSLGLWAFFTERITGLIPKERFFWKDFPEFFEAELKPATAILVNLRNKYHHGAVPSDEECTRDLTIAMPYLEKILFGNPIGEDRMVLGEVIQGSNARQVFLENSEGRKLELSPLLHAEISAKSKKEEFFYFNDAKKWDKSTINTISYDNYENKSNKEIFQEFRKSFPITDWEKTKVSRFANRILELTENFQGRSTELQKIKTFLTEFKQGFFFIWGGPGMGKSALVARSLVLLRAGLEEKTEVGQTGFDLGTKDVFILEYFIRRGSTTEKEDTFYTMLGEDLESIFGTGISIGNNIQEKREKWKTRLEKIQRKLNGSENIREEEEETSKPKKESKKKEDSFVGKKLILCIDGLDEGEEGILKSIPRGSDLYADFQFVLGGRDVTQTRTLYTTLDADKKDQIILEGLGKEDIRAMMLRVVQQIDLLTEEYVSKLKEMSGGNPLYLKMIADSIERGEREVGDLQNLPAGVDNLYDGIYERIEKRKDSEILLKILYFFTFTKDFICVDIIRYFFNLDYFDADFYVDEIREILWQDPSTDGAEFFQLFHESLRDYLKKKYDRNRFQTQETILSKLDDWKPLCEEGIDPRTARYILQYAVSHLLEEGHQKTAEKFVLNPEFINRQVEYLNFYTVSLDDAGKVLGAIVEELGGKPGTTRPLDEIFQPKQEGEEYRTTTLVRLVNHAGELGHRAGTDIGIAWTWIEEGKIAEALERLSPIEDKQRLFDCYLFAIWLLTQQEDGEENRAGLKLVLEEVEKKIPKGDYEMVYWTENYPIELFVELFITLIVREQEVNEIFKRGIDSNKKDLLKYLISFKYRLDENSKIIFHLNNKVFLKIQLSIIIKLILEINDIDEKIESLSDLSEYIFRNENNYLCSLLISKFLDILYNFEPPILYKIIYNFIINLFTYGNVELVNLEIPRVYKQINKIEDSDEKSRFISEMLQSIVGLDKHKQAKIILPSLVKYSLNINESHILYSVIINLSRILSIIDDESSLIFLPELVEKSKILDSFFFSKTLLELGLSVSQINDRDLKVRIIKRLEEINSVDFEENYYTICVIGELYLTIDEVELGIKNLKKSFYLAHKIKQLEDKLFAYNYLCSVFLKFNMINSAIEILNETFEIINTLEDDENFLEPILDISINLIKTKKLEFAEFILKKCLNIYYDNENISSRDVIIEKIFVNIINLKYNNKTKNETHELIRSILKEENNDSFIDMLYKLFIIFKESKNVTYKKQLYRCFRKKVILSKPEERKYLFDSALNKFMSKNKLIDSFYIIKFFIKKSKIINNLKYENEFKLNSLKLITNTEFLKSDLELFCDLITFSNEILNDEDKKDYLFFLIILLYNNINNKETRNIFNNINEIYNLDDKSYFSYKLYLLVYIIEGNYINIKSIIANSIVNLKKVEVSINLNITLSILSVELFKKGVFFYNNSKDIESNNYFKLSQDFVSKIDEFEYRTNLIIELSKFYNDLKEYNSIISITNEFLNNIRDRISRVDLDKILKNFTKYYIDNKNSEIINSIYPILFDSYNYIDDLKMTCESTPYLIELLIQIEDLKVFKRYINKLLSFFLDDIKNVSHNAIKQISYISNINILIESIIKYNNENITDEILNKLLNDINIFDIFFNKEDLFSKIIKCIVFFHTEKMIRVHLPIIVKHINNFKNSKNKSIIIYNIEDSNYDSIDIIITKKLFLQLEKITYNIDDELYKSITLSKLATFYIRIGLIQKGKSLFKEAINIAFHFEINYWKIYILNEIAFNYYTIDYKDESYKLYSESINFIKVLFDLKSLENLVESISKIKKTSFLEGLFSDLVEEINKYDDLYQVSTLNFKIGILYYKNNNYAKASYLFNKSYELTLKIIDSVGRSSVFLGILENINEYKIYEAYEIFFLNNDINEFFKYQDSKKLFTAISKLSSVFENKSNINLFETNFSSSKILPEIRILITREYRKVDYFNVSENDLFPYFLRTFTWSPYDGEFGKESAYHLVESMAKLGKVEEALEAFKAIPYTPPKPSESTSDDEADLEDEDDLEGEDNTEDEDDSDDEDNSDDDNL